MNAQCKNLIFSLITMSIEQFTLSMTKAKKHFNP